jgi:hypothetical protein
MPTIAVGLLDDSIALSDINNLHPDASKAASPTACHAHFAPPGERRLVPGSGTPRFDRAIVARVRDGGKGGVVAGAEHALREPTTGICRGCQVFSCSASLPCDAILQVAAHVSGRPAGSRPRWSVLVGDRGPAISACGGSLQARPRPAARAWRVRKIPPCRCQ